MIEITPPVVSSASTPPARDAFVPNLIVLILVGVAISAWLLTFTDWFAEFSALLALSGLFTWISVVSKLLREERVKDLQARLDRAVFQRLNWGRYLLVAIVLVVVPSFLGTTEVRSIGDSSERVLWFDYNPTAPQTADRLPPFGRVRDVRFTTLWGPTQIRVKVGGYPSLLVPVRPWRRSSVDVPTSLLLSNPVVLLQPTSKLMAFAQGLTLVVTAGGQTRRRPFDGHSVWIGCEDDVQVPARLVDEWRSTNEGRALLAKWESPRAIDLPLTHGTVLEVKLLNEDGSEYVKRTGIHARRPGRPQEFPQVEALDVPP
jgi:hypothetical protein